MNSFLLMLLIMVFGSIIGILAAFLWNKVKK